MHYVCMYVYNRSKYPPPNLCPLSAVTYKGPRPAPLKQGLKARPDQESAFLGHRVAGSHLHGLMHSGRKYRPKNQGTVKGSLFQGKGMSIYVTLFFHLLHDITEKSPGKKRPQRKEVYICHYFFFNFSL